jgi:riboflavin kinase / FMN adenylyltransferase
MQIFHAIPGLLQIPAHSVMTIGNFDGVHLGHQQMLRTARKIAREKNSPLVFVTFEPHPMTVLRPQSAPPRLTPADVKLKLLESEHPDFVVILPPEKEILSLTAEGFWDILWRQAKVADLVEGKSFRFGHGAKGTVALLAKWSAQTETKIHIIDSVEVPLLDLQITPVSSSAIRFLLAYGRVRDAAICLGRPYALTGTVQKGFSRGKSLGFPTANLNIADQLIPADGVYAARCTLDGKPWPAALSIGTNPTFNDQVRQIEPHLIGFTGDLYGQTLTIEVLDWIREQRAYPGPEPLKSQIQKDIGVVMALNNRPSVRPITA